VLVAQRRHPLPTQGPIGIEEPSKRKAGHDARRDSIWGDVSGMQHADHAEQETHHSKWKANDGCIKEDANERWAKMEEQISDAG
jgi:hypothetical protein